METLFISSKNLGLMLIPQWRYDIIFSAFYLSFTKELFPLHLGHHSARLVMTQMMLSEKSLQKKKVSPPSQTEAHPLRHSIQAKLSQFIKL